VKLAERDNPFAVSPPSDVAGGGGAPEINTSVMTAGMHSTSPLLGSIAGEAGSLCDRECYTAMSCDGGKSLRRGNPRDAVSLVDRIEERAWR